MPFDRGSLWRKWDLQVHTPVSLVHNYSGTEAEQWDRYLDDLESLPSEFSVLGISDYLFLDGYKRLRQEKAKGRLTNIDLLLPVIELRLKMFGGTSGHLRKVNIHVIFSDDLEPEIIEGQFHGALRTSFSLTPRAGDLEWNALLTPASLTDLGNKIIESVPQAERDKFDRPALEGFNNITFTLKDIKEALSSYYFSDKHLIAVGKTEWASVKWTHQSIADKKTVINEADLVFISSPNPDHFRNAKDKLASAEVSYRLFDCSDAHHFSSSADKDRLGNCMTWVKADPTFQGLSQALVEYADRVFIGDEPQRWAKLRQAPEMFINAVELRRKPQGEFAERWFENLSLKLNPGMVSIIGNKGMGKSALAEGIAVAGNTGVDRSYFSFLTEDRFCNPRENKAQHFEVEVERASQTARTCRLDSPPDDAAHEAVIFLPQNFLEELCSDPESEEQFTSQINEVVFSHVSEADKLGKGSLEALLKQLTEETESELRRLQLDLGQINERIVGLREQLSADNRKRVQEEYRRKRREVLRHKAQKPAPICKPSEDPELAAEIEEKRKKKGELSVKIGEAEAELKAAKQERASAKRISEALDNLETEIAKRLGALSEDLELLELEATDLVKVEFQAKPLEERISSTEGRIESLDRTLDPTEPESLAYRQEEMRKQIEQLRGKLKEPARKYQAHLEALEDWREQRVNLIGDSDTPGSLKQLRAEFGFIRDTGPQTLTDLLEERREKVREIFSRIEHLCDRYRELHRPVQDFMASHPAIQEELDLQFDVLIAPRAFDGKFLDLIHQGRRGSFQGKQEGRERLRAVMKEHNLDEQDGVIAFTERLLELLTSDVNSDPPEQREIANQLRDGLTVVEALNFIFGLSWLRPRYVMRFGGRDLPSLSPGERGLVLLVFYLLVSRDERPLIIDQPEGNLDNESVYRVLVPCIREAKKRRQLIIVTHNPNLAVVCDSEQIIRAAIDKDSDFHATYTSGSIENPAINAWLVDVLEGTWPAFDRRRERYYPYLSEG